MGFDTIQCGVSNDGKVNTPVEKIASIHFSAWRAKMRRREFLFSVAAAGSIGLIGPARAANEKMIVYKDPNCGCCRAWAEAMKAAGFSVSTEEAVDLAALKGRYAIPRRCTAAIRQLSPITTSKVTCHWMLSPGYSQNARTLPDLRSPECPRDRWAWATILARRTMSLPSMGMVPARCTRRLGRRADQGFSRELASALARYVCLCPRALSRLVTRMRVRASLKLSRSGEASE